MYKRFFLLLIFTQISLSYGCSFSTADVISTSAEENAGRHSVSCIPPIVNYAYPTNRKSDSLNSPTQVAPSSPWASEVPLPSVPNGITAIDKLSFTRGTSSSPAIWVIRDEYQSGDGTVLLKGRGILVYESSSRVWNNIPVEIDGFQGELSQLFLLTDGSVWASFSNQSGSILSIFNEEERRFEAVDVDLPGGRIFLDHDTFWIFSSGAIFSLNSPSLKIEKRTEIPNLDVGFSRGVTFASDGSIYFINSYKELVSKSDIEIYHFMPSSNSIEKILNIDLQNRSPFSSLFVDRTGNLWVSDHGWMSTDGIWHEVIRSPLFITDRMPEHPTLYWQSPGIILESSDGRLWFDSYNGIVSLNPEKGEWCWFTTYQSNIVEDSDHNLWMIADGKLYKLALEK